MSELLPLHFLDSYGREWEIEEWAPDEHSPDGAWKATVYPFPYTGKPYPESGP